ncbi:hypothetical protein GS896_27560 [Rhodococcus hoagii]|nr:hypothetical protein [Prescottella equi]MBM4654010.1 hypothetical protein [Prescottella equi]MBM4719727.1 hypothetical protein [Prescottella equi]NKR23524.1 hypothetical protein [Prescottella equi]NKT56322.1 hypothetical protein [Prescottella equi]
MNESSTIRELADDRLEPRDLGDDDPRVAVEVSADGSVSAIFSEALQFHRDRGLPDGIVDGGGELTDGGRVRIETYLRGLLRERTGLDGAALAVNTDDQTSVIGEEPGFAVVLHTQADPATAFRDYWDNTGWPFFALMINVSDPGTFNHPYLFAHI